MTNASRQQRKRDRVKAGLVRIEVWVPKEYEDLIKGEITYWLAGYERFDAVSSQIEVETNDRES